MENSSQFQPLVTSEIPQSVQTQPKSFPLIIGGVVIVTALLSGFIGYYLGMQNTQNLVSNGGIQEAPIATTTSLVNENEKNDESTPGEIDPTARGGGVEADWLTYTDAFNSYSIRYPKEWSLVKATCTTCATTLSTYQEGLSTPSEPYAGEGSISITIYDTNSQQLADWKNKNVEVVSESTFSWNNLSGVSRIEKRMGYMHPGENSQLETLYDERGDKTIVITVYPIISPVENAILSSFSMK